MAIKSHKQQQQQQQQRLNTHLQDLKYKHYYPLGFNLYCIVMPCVEWKRGHQNRKKEKFEKFNWRWHTWSPKITQIEKVLPKVEDTPIGV